MSIKAQYQYFCDLLKMVFELLLVPASLGYGTYIHYAPEKLSWWLLATCLFLWFTNFLQRMFIDIFSNILMKRKELEEPINQMRDSRESTQDVS